ncbi:MAG TPA: VWA domain-containing protein [Xanthobacteraceae bacterium]|nr:VWA domain-containing protein [Xanthobacteraceae bacterium]
MMPSLATPLVLLALPLPLLAAYLLRPSGTRSAALRVPASILPPADGAGGGAGARRAPVLLAWAAWIALVVALSGPRIVTHAAALPMSGREIVLALDVSGSMESKDFLLDGAKVRRLDAVKAVAAEFLRRRGGDRIGLVFFAEQAEMAAVPTFDLASVEGVLAETEIGLLGRSTAIGDGLGLALKRLNDSSAPSRLVVLLSDGANTAGIVGADAAAALARDLGIRVHTIALGSDELAADGLSGEVDASTLARIAETSGGRAFRVRTTDDLRAVTAAIDAMEAGRMAGAPVSLARDLWPYPAVLALALCLAGATAGRARP